MIQFNPIQQKHKEDTNGHFVYFNRILKHIMKPMDFQSNLEAPRYGSVNLQIAFVSTPNCSIVQQTYAQDMGVSKNRGGPPKWMVKIMENPN